MNPNPQSSKVKIAYTGTNCSGKTTAALDTTVRLKLAGVLAEVVSSQDRKISWKDDHFPVDYRAHYGMMTNLIHAEVQAELKGDAQVVVTDRSILDLYAIATYDHPTNPQIAAMEQMVLAWASSYTRIYYLEPLPYQADNKRPNDDFRMATHGQLIKLMDKYQLPNVVRVSRSDVWSEIRKLLALPPNPVFDAEAKWQRIADEIGMKLLVRDPHHPKPNDADIWVVQGVDQTPEQAVSARVRAEQLYDLYFGSDLPCHVMITVETSKRLFSGSTYTPTAK